MAHPIIPLLVALSYAAPHVDLNAKAKDPISCMKQNPAIILIAEAHGGEDPHGDDPHGTDPHDEYHDKSMPAEKYKKEYKAPKDAYGGDVPNSHLPY